MTDMHSFDESTDELAWQIFRYALNRVRLDPPPLDGPRSAEDLAAAVGATITAEGLGGTRALQLFTDELAPSCISTDHQRYLSFVPNAPTEAAVLFDVVVGASSLYGGSWLEGAGAVHAENEALRWLADLVGLPPSAGGVFVSGGTAGNLSALVAARHHARSRRHAQHKRDSGPVRWGVVASATAHSSIAAAAAVMDVEIVPAETNSERKLTGAAVSKALASAPADVCVFAVVATAGSTNLGIVDDLATVSAMCAENDTWFHVDAAYGGAALAAPSVRDRFAGIERSDSVVIDPHKWLFAPYDCAALLYREPEIARRAHAQHAGYLEPLEGAGWNPSDYAHVLTRRARGLPLWFSLATHGTRAYSEAVEHTIELAREIATVIAADDRFELVVEPELSVVAFRRRGWDTSQYDEWSRRLLESGQAFVTPTTVDGETALRFCIVSPRTTLNGLREILDTL